MKERALEELRKNHFLKVILFLFLALTIWWISMFVRDLQGGSENNAFTLIYPWFSLVGSVAGFYVGSKWGGFESFLGGAISMFAFGLLAQFIGQAIYAYYIYINGIEVPYPSWGDLGYFGSVICYIIGAILLTKVSGFTFSVRSLKGKLISFAIPVILLLSSYAVFLRDYQLDSIDYLKTFLDFGYPLGQAIYVSLAILALLMSKNILGGIMQKPISFLLIALVIQYLCDFMFLYQVSRGTWYVGGINDFMYLVSYFVMTVSLVVLGLAFERIKSS